MPSGQHGTILITAVGVVIVFTILGASFMHRTMSETRISGRSTAQQDAFYLADAAVDRAALNLRTPNDPSDDVTSDTLPTGSYTIDTPELVGTLQYEVTTHGTARSEQRHIEALLRVVFPSVFQFGLFGDEGVTIEDDVSVDSYNSDDGAYEDQVPGDNGDVGTNNTEEDSIVVEGEVTIDGQLAVGPDMANPTDATRIEGNVTISADPDVVSQSEAMEMPAVTPPATCEGAKVIGDGEVLALDANAQSDYCYASLRLYGTGAITVTGNVTVYTGDLKIENDATVNANGKPTQLVFQVTSANEVKIENNGVFVGAVYAPQSTVKLENNVEIFGAVVSKTIKVENATALHYDEALAEVGPSNGQPAEVRLLSWREVPQ